MPADYRTDSRARVAAAACAQLLISVFCIAYASIGLSTLSDNCLAKPRQHCANPLGTFWVTAIFIALAHLPASVAALCAILYEVAFILQATALHWLVRNPGKLSQEHSLHRFLAMGDVGACLLLLGACAFFVIGIIGMHACVFEGCHAGLGLKYSLSLVICGIIVHLASLICVCHRYRFRPDKRDEKWERFCSSKEHFLRLWRKRWSQVPPSPDQEENVELSEGYDGHKGQSGLV